MCPGEVGLFTTQPVEAHEHFSQKTENHVLILKPVEERSLCAAELAFMILSVLPNCTKHC